LILRGDYWLLREFKNKEDDLMFGKGLFGSFFDWDFDGKLDSFEQATDMAAFMLLMDDIKKSDGEDFEDESLDDNLFDDSDDDELY